MPCSALDLAIRFHETYERLAPQFGYETRLDTRAFDPTSKNGKLMVAVCAEILEQNVKEHATLSAGASVERGVEVKTTEEHENMAADGGCCASSCSPSCFRLEVVDHGNGEVLTWIDQEISERHPKPLMAVKAFKVVFRDFQAKQAANHPNNPRYFLRVVWPDGSRNPSQSLEQWSAELESELRQTSTSP